MNFIEFRRALMIDPGAARLDDASAALGNEAVAALRNARALDREIANALAVPVPEEFEQRLLARLAQERAATRPARWMRWTGAALAASVALAAVLWRGAAPDPTQLLMSDAAAHLSHEPFALTRTERVPAPLIERTFATAGRAVDGQRLPLNYLSRCPVESRMALHMVVRHDTGPVTALLFPRGAAVERMDAHMDGIAVRAVPYLDGALVLLAESSRDFDAVETALHNAGPRLLAAGGR